MSFKGRQKEKNITKQEKAYKKEEPRKAGRKRFQKSREKTVLREWSGESQALKKSSKMSKESTGLDD